LAKIALAAGASEPPSDVGKPRHPAGVWTTLAKTS
jgi:hypothetical protein